MIASENMLALKSFYLPWLAAAAVASGEPAQPGLLVHLADMDLPVVQMVLAMAGVLMARPLAPRGTPPLSLGKSLLVTAIMLIAALAWVTDKRPGVLFTFVVSIGLGFSGFALIELAGQELLDTVKAFFAAVRARITGTGK